MKTLQTRWLEDINCGERFDYGAYTFTRQGIIAFARKYDPQPFHLDDKAARESHFGALCASGWHTAAAFMKCFTRFEFAAREAAERTGAPLPPLGPSPGFEDLRWPRPVFVDDTVSYQGEVTAGRVLKSRPGWGMVTCAITGANQVRQVVFSYRAKLMIAARAE